MALYYTDVITMYNIDLANKGISTTVSLLIIEGVCIFCYIFLQGRPYPGSMLPNRGYQPPGMAQPPPGMAQPPPGMAQPPLGMAQQPPMSQQSLRR